MTKKLTSFKAALSFPNRTIAHIYSQIKQQELILQRIHQALPATIAEHALHCVVNGKKLLLYTETAAWASQLRFYSSVILAAIAPVTRESISIVQIKVRGETSLTGRKREMPAGEEITSFGRKPNIPSAEKIAFIHDYSLNVADRQLKQALLRLSSTLEKLSKTKSQTD